MNISNFFASKILQGTTKSKGISYPLLKLSYVGVSLSIIIMILSVSILIGFQSAIRSKVVGFGGHIRISNFDGNLSYESTPIKRNQEFYKKFNNIDKVENVQVYALKSGLLKHDNIVEGIVLKGIDSDFNKSFFNDNIIEGRFIHFNDKNESKEIVLSSTIANKLNLKLEDEVLVYFIRFPEQTIIKKLKLVGIYSTGLTDFDEKFSFLDIKYIQKYNNWGIKTFLQLKEIKKDSLLVSASSFGGNSRFLYSWNFENKFTSKSNKYFPLGKDSILVTLIANQDGYRNEFEDAMIPDTAFLNIMYDNSKAIDDISAYSTDLKTTGGSSKYYVGGFEVNLKSYKDIYELDDIMYSSVPANFDTKTIIDLSPEIFNWLNLLDFNVYIIIGLMIIVAIVNISSTLMVLILEKTNFIGILKTLGYNNWHIRKIFLAVAYKILLKGLFWGNLIVLALLFIQKYFGLVKLSEETYFMSTVPVEINWFIIIGINLLTIFVSIIVLIIPSYFITKMDPVKTVKFS